MARKDLSRTVIEGGRYYHNSYLRRASHGEHRATTREWLDHLDDADATDPPPLARVRKLFRDKLGPARRWLVAQVGRPWNHIFSELCSRFDTRTIAGRHVVYDHLLGEVRRWDAPGNLHYGFDLVIDRHGILRKGPRFGISYRKLVAQIRTWANGRVAARTHRGWEWFRIRPRGAPCRDNACARAHHEHGTSWPRDRYHGLDHVRVGMLTRADLRALEELPSTFRNSVVIALPRS